MTRVGQADQILALVREQLARLSRERAGRAQRSAPSGQPTPPAIERLRMLDLGDLSEREARRTVVRALLTQEMGEALANEPSFQPILEDVVRMIEDSEAGRTLLERAMRELAGMP